MNTIYFDMDGTFYNLYGFDGWLDCILSEKTECYKNSTMLVDYDSFVNVLSELKEKGYTIGIITWLSKNTKYHYIKKHFGNLFDEVHIIQYGKDKSYYCQENDILFDDEKPNREKWENKNGIAYDVMNIIDILESMVK